MKNDTNLIEILGNQVDYNVINYCDAQDRIHEIKQILDNDTTDVLAIENLQKEQKVLEEKTKQFVIDSPNKADWAVMKIKEEQERSDIFIRAIDSHIEELKLKKKEEQERCATKTVYLLDKLGEYIETVPAVASKTQKSLKLPSGKIIKKFPRQEISGADGSKELKNNEELINYVKGDGDDYVKYIKISEQVDWKEFKKDLVITMPDNEYDEARVLRHSNGEIIDFLQVVEIPAEVKVQ